MLTPAGCCPKCESSCTSNVTSWTFTHERFLCCSCGFEWTGAAVDPADVAASKARALAFGLRRARSENLEP